MSNRLFWGALCDDRMHTNAGKNDKGNLFFNCLCAVKQGKRDECYETSLRIQRVELNDARHYYLTVENDKGSDSFYVTLTVKGMRRFSSSSLPVCSAAHTPVIVMFSELLTAIIRPRFFF